MVLPRSDRTSPFSFDLLVFKVGGLPESGEGLILFSLIEKAGRRPLTARCVSDRYLGAGLDSYAMSRIRAFGILTSNQEYICNFDSHKIKIGFA